jgi:hypothetical protein
MWVFDGESWNEEGGCGNNTPVAIDYRRYREVQPQLQIQEAPPEPPAGVRNPTPWVPARRIKR